MGIFDILETIVEKTAETVIEIPAIPLKIARGTVKGSRKAMSKISDDYEDLVDEINDN